MEKLNELDKEWWKLIDDPELIPTIFKHALRQQDTALASECLKWWKPRDTVMLTCFLD
jgi:hypothetical protein